MNILAQGGAVLFLDDNETDLYLVKRCFKTAGYSNEIVSFEQASDLMDYLKEVESGRKPMPSVLILDINMPAMDGWEVFKEMKANSKFKTLPFIFFLTNSSAAEDIKKAKDLGSKGFFTKPSTLAEYAEIFEKIRKMLAQPGNE